jgi:hypothetical protein
MMYLYVQRRYRSNLQELRRLQRLLYRPNAFHCIIRLNVDSVLFIRGVRY